MTRRDVLTQNSLMRIRTSRIGLLTVHAVAPIVAGRLSETDLTFTVQIDEVTTGNPLLDPELHALIHRITGGTLTFTGQRSEGGYAGTATAGQITIPLDLLTRIEATTVAVSGTSTFSDLHVALPGMEHIKHLEVDIEGHLNLA